MSRRHNFRPSRPVPRELELGNIHPEPAPDEEQLLWAHIDNLCQLDELADVVEPAIKTVFEESQRKDAHATRVLKIFVWPVALLSAAGFLGFVAFAATLGGPVERNVVLAVCVSVASLIQNLLSYYATGWAPHVASQKANKAQDAYSVIQERYVRKYLLVLVLVVAVSLCECLSLCIYSVAA
jgi:hypothetical protein